MEETSAKQVENVPEQTQKLRTLMNEVQSAFLEVVKDCRRTAFLSIAKELQHRARNSAKGLAVKVIDVQSTAIHANNEDAANSLLSILYALGALHAELSMWIALKEDRMEQAWDKLVESQSLIIASNRAKLSDAGLGNYLDHLHSIEKTVFPPQIFLSTGMIVEAVKCSICFEEYEKCRHLVGKPYMGKLCCEIITKCKRLLEVSIVDEPADKSCRMTNIEVDGRWTNTLTGLERPNDLISEAKREAAAGFTRFEGYGIRHPKEIFSDD